MKNPVYGVNCKKSGGLLFGLTSLDDNNPDGPKGIVGNPEFKQSAEGRYFVCPHCKARNMTAKIAGEPPQLQITHAV